MFLKSLVFKRGKKSHYLIVNLPHSRIHQHISASAPSVSGMCRASWTRPPHSPVTQTYTDLWNRMYKSLCLALNSAGPQHKQLRLLFLSLRLLLHSSQVQHYITDGATTHPQKKKKKEEPEQRLQKEEEIHTYRIQRFLPLSSSLSHTHSKREEKKTWLNPGHLSVLPFGDEGGKFGR